MSLKIFGAKGISLMKLPRDVPLDGGINPCTKFGGTATLKFGKTNLARFRTTFDFHRKSL